jgi:hypothetical protein
MYDVSTAFTVRHKVICPRPPPPQLSQFIILVVKLEMSSFVATLTLLLVAKQQLV